MLGQNQIVNGIVFEKFHGVPEVFGIVLHLQTDGNPDLVPIGPAQALQGFDIALQLDRPHPDVGIVAPGENVGGMVCKAEDVKSGLDGLLNILLLPPNGMAATEGVGMVIRFHKTASFCPYSTTIPRFRQRLQL